MLSCLAALVLTQTAQPTGAFPKPVDEQPAAEYLSWAGFGFLPAENRGVPKDFRVSGDWSGVEAAAAKPEEGNPVPWRLKVFVIRRVDEVLKLPDGTLYEDQCSLETPDLDRIRRSIEQLKGLVQVASRGRLKLEPDISIEQDPITLRDLPLAQRLETYMLPRFNGGSYEAEDHVYRGPYASVFCIHPIPGPDRERVTLNHTPVTILSGYGSVNYPADGILTLALEDAWVKQVAELAVQSGLQGYLAGVSPIQADTGLPDPLAFVPDNDWASIMAGPELDPAKIESRLKLPVENPQSDQTQPKLYLNAYKGDDCEVKIETDPDRGSILTYSERGSARNGGVDLPTIAGLAPIIDPGKTPSLSFWARSASRDPLALDFHLVNSSIYEVCLGRDRIGDSAVQADFPRDGQWHEVKVDLSHAGAPIASISIVPSKESLLHPKLTLGPILYSFSDYKVGADPAPGASQLTPDPDSPDSWLRAEWAHKAAPSTKLLPLLKDPEWFVRLNALQTYIGNPDPSAEAALTENANLAIDGPVNAAALDALWSLGTASAKAVVDQALKTGITERGKAEAALLETEGHDASVAPKLIALSQSRTLETRLADVQALSRLSGPTAAQIRGAILFQSDSELHLAVTKASDASDPNELRELRWSAVNEPSDAVRTESCIKLISSPDAQVRKDGYAGIKDDSVGVRLNLLEYFAGHPDENQRDAIRIAVTDRSARVKAAALRAFAALPKAVSLDEIGAAAGDRRPAVQLAMADLARKKGLKLSEEILSLMRNSPDPMVRAACKDLE